MKDVIRTQAEGVEFINRWAAVKGDGPYHVEIREFKRPKTAEQRAKFHILVRQMAIQAGMDPDELKDWFKAMYGPARAIEVNVQVLDGDRLRPEKTVKVVPYSSESWSVDQCSEMIDHVYRVAAENGYSLE